MSVLDDPFEKLRQIATQPTEPKSGGRGQSLADWWEFLVERDGQRCFYCWKPLSHASEIHPESDDAPSIEHVVARTKGGNWIKENLVLACRYCNCLVRGHSVAWKVAFRDEMIAKRLAQRMNGGGK